MATFGRYKMDIICEMTSVNKINVIYVSYVITLVSSSCNARDITQHRGHILWLTTKLKPSQSFTNIHSPPQILDTLSHHYHVALDKHVEGRRDTGPVMLHFTLIPFRHLLCKKFNHKPLKFHYYVKLVCNLIGLTALLLNCSNVHCDPIGLTVVSGQSDF